MVTWIKVADKKYLASCNCGNECYGSTRDEALDRWLELYSEEEEFRR
jgi:hypothetical protein